MEQKTQQTQRQAASQVQRDDDDTIDLLELAEYLWKRILIILAAVLAGGALALAYTVFLVTPEYSSSAMLYVNNGSLSLGSTSVSIASGDLTASRNLVETYLVILNSRETLEEVIDEMGLPYTYTQLSSMISAAAVNDTEIFEVTVTSTDPDEAAEIANTIVKVLPTRIKNIVDGSNAVRVDAAVPVYTPISPNVMKNTAMGALIGLVLSCGVYVVLFLMDTEIHSESYLLRTYPNIPLLTVVPNVNSSGSGHGYSYGYGYGYGYGQRHSASSATGKKIS